MLKIGDHAPDFSLPDQSGANVTLEDCLAKGSLILYFYPADFTPVCSAEARAFGDKFPELESIGTQVVGISPQDSGSHARFASALGIPFPLLADTQKSAIRAYGVDGPFGMGVRRVTFLIEPDRTIKNRVVSDFFLGSHTDLLRKTLREAGN